MVREVRFAVLAAVNLVAAQICVVCETHLDVVFAVGSGKAGTPGAECCDVRGGWQDGSLAQVNVCFQLFARSLSGLVSLVSTRGFQGR